MSVTVKRIVLDLRSGSNVKNIFVKFSLCLHHWRSSGGRGSAVVLAFLPMKAEFMFVVNQNSVMIDV